MFTRLTAFVLGSSSEPQLRVPEETKNLEPEYLTLDASDDDDETTSESEKEVLFEPTTTTIPPPPSYDSVIKNEAVQQQIDHMAEIEQIICSMEEEIHKREVEKKKKNAAYFFTNDEGDLFGVCNETGETLPIEEFDDDDVAIVTDILADDTRVQHNVDDDDYADMPPLIYDDSSSSDECECTNCELEEEVVDGEIVEWFCPECGALLEEVDEDGYGWSCGNCQVVWVDDDNDEGEGIEEDKFDVVVDDDGDADAYEYNDSVEMIDAFSVSEEKQDKEQEYGDRTEEISDVSSEFTSSVTTDEDWDTSADDYDSMPSLEEIVDTTTVAADYECRIETMLTEMWKDANRTASAATAQENRCNTELEEDIAVFEKNIHVPPFNFDMKWEWEPTPFAESADVLPKEFMWRPNPVFQNAISDDEKTDNNTFIWHSTPPSETIERFEWPPLINFENSIPPPPPPTPPPQSFWTTNNPTSSFENTGCPECGSIVCDDVCLADEKPIPPKPVLRAEITADMEIDELMEMCDTILNDSKNKLEEIKERV